MAQESKESEKSSFIDKAIDFLFSNDRRKWLLAFLIIGFILRFLVANHINLIADEMLHGTHAINVIHSGVINLQNEAPAWFYLTDIAYMIFGVKAFAGRFLSIIFGAFTILLIYSIGKELFDEKVGLIAACLLTFSAYTIRYTLMEMDIAMMFFVLLSFYYFHKDIKGKNTISYYTPIFMGVAILMKPIALPFLAAYALYFILFMKGEERNSFLKKNKKKAVLSILILALFAMPIIAYNLILYSQKGLTDVLFARFFHISPGIYQGLLGFDRTFSVGYLFSDGIKFTIKYAFWDLDPAIFVLSLLGLVMIFTKKEYKEGRFFAVFHIFTLIFLMGTSLLQTHFVSFVPLLCISAAIFVKDTSERFKSKVPAKQTIIILLAVVILVNMVLIFPHLTSKSAIFQMRDYASANFGDNDVVVADGRIYRGRIAWMFNDKMYVEAPLFAQLIGMQGNISGQTVNTNVYFVECVMDDCGWGTIGGQPEFNASMEEMVSVFEKAAIDKKTIYGGGGFEDETGKPYFNIYKTVIPLKSQSFPIIKDTHDWFYYPVRWEKSDWYDKYYPKGVLQILLQLIGKTALWAAVIIALLSPFLLFSEIFRRKKDKSNQ